MPSPTYTDVHVNAPLSNISVGYLQDSADYIADKVFPVVPVQKASNIYFVLTRDFWFRDEAQIRVDGTESVGTGYGVAQQTYTTQVYALHYDLGPMVRANTDNPLDAEADATVFLTQRLAISRERQFLSKYFTTGTWTGSTTGTDITPGTKWDVTNSTPIEDIEAQQFNIKATTGFWPNRFVLGANAYKALKNHAEILDRLKYTQRGVVTTDVMASILSPPNQPEAADGGAFKIVVASAVYNSAAEGATASMGFAATKTDAMLCYAAPNPGIRVPSAGYIFTWTPIAGYLARIKQIQMPWLGTDENGTPTTRIEAEMSFDMNLVAADMGAYFSAATS